MLQRKVLPDGSIELGSARCTFVYRRLRPGALLVRISGNDSGESVMETLDEVSAEIGRFGQLDLFIDLSGVTGAAPRVTDAWAAWFRANRQSIRRVSMLATSKPLYIMASTVALLSHTDNLIRVYEEAEPFEQALAREIAADPQPRPRPAAHSAPSLSPPSRPPPAAVPARRETLADGSVRLTGPSCGFLYRRLRPGLLLVNITGDDKGELGTAAIDEISAEIGRFGPLELFVDTAGASGVDTRVSELWTAWFRDNQPRLKRVSILATSRFVHLAVSIAKHFSRTGDLIRIYDDAAAFEQAIARAAMEGSHA